MSGATPALSAEGLRQAALDALGPYADARARAALQDAHVRVDAAVTAWESSGGRVQGHRVTLAVDAATLARLRVVPALEDALHAALAAAVSAQPGHALAALALVWAREGPRATQDGYRDRPPAPPQTLEEALASYLDARGEAEVARLVVDARLDVRPGGGGVLPGVRRISRGRRGGARGPHHGRPRSARRRGRARRRRVLTAESHPVGHGIVTVTSALQISDGTDVPGA